MSNLQSSAEGLPADGIALADLLLVRESLLERILQMRTAGAPADDIAVLMADYDHYTDLGRRP